MALCSACDSFIKNIFKPPTQELDDEYSSIRNELCHLRLHEIFASAGACELCHLIKMCCRRTFRHLLKDDAEATFLQFISEEFEDLGGPVYLGLDKCRRDFRDDGPAEENAEPWRPRSGKIQIRISKPKDFAKSGNEPSLEKRTLYKISQRINLSVWARPASPAAISGDVCDVEPIRDDNSPEIFVRINSRLEHCINNHDGCRETLSGNTIDETVEHELPTRVIDVQPGEENFVRLIETHGRSGHYAALSHCWGPPEKRPLDTKKATFQQRLSGIPLNGLPKTFREAVETTRALNIRYLWIDSLCIVQDDHADWESEAKTMGALYEKARVVIAATDAADASKGLFLTHRRLTDPIVEVPYVPDGQEADGTILLSAGPASAWVHSGSCLSDRAWVFQERYLARRLVSFTAAGFLWECKSLKTLGVPFALDERSLEQNTEGITGSRWQKDLEEYTQRRLTYESDRLVAIEGLAREIQRKTGARYYMGVWMHEIHSSLLWLRIAQFERDLRDDRQDRIPTWCWAALPGRKWYVEDDDFWRSKVPEEPIFLSSGAEVPASGNFQARFEEGVSGSLGVQSFIKRASAQENSYEWLDILNVSDDEPGLSRFENMDWSFFPLKFFQLSGVFSILDPRPGGDGASVGFASFDVAFVEHFHCLYLRPGLHWSGKEGEKIPDDDKWLCYVLLLEETSKPFEYRRIGLGIITSKTWMEGERVQCLSVV